MADLPYVITWKVPTTEMNIAGGIAAAEEHQTAFTWVDTVSSAYGAMLSASGCPVSLDEIVGVLASLVAKIEDRIDACDEQIAGLRGKDGEWPRMHEIDMEKMWLWALLDESPARSLLHRLKAQTPGKE